MRFVAIPVMFVFSGVFAWPQSQDDVNLLQDSGGWEYLSISDKDNGFPTQHVCFNMHETGKCRGKLTFNADGTFNQSVTVHGSSLVRHGTYQLSGNQVTFVDEFGNKDGPYDWTINSDAKSLVVKTTQAGVLIRMDLLLEKEFHRRLDEQKKKHQQP